MQWYWFGMDNRGTFPQISERGFRKDKEHIWRLPNSVKGYEIQAYLRRYSGKQKNLWNIFFYFRKLFTKKDKNLILCVVKNDQTADYLGKQLTNYLYSNASLYNKFNIREKQIIANKHFYRMAGICKSGQCFTKARLNRCCLIVFAQEILKATILKTPKIKNTILFNMLIRLAHIYYYDQHLQQLLMSTNKIIADKLTMWLDCDPGIDDAIAIIYAAKSPKINFLGLSTSPGNTYLNYTTKNALDLLHITGRNDVPVVRGSEKLIKGELKTAEHVHGQGGLGGVVLPSSPKQAITENNFKTIASFILGSKQKVYWANTGSLTNLAILLDKHPEVKENIESIVLMGGAVGKGNMTPAAEFNIWVDPCAFEQVLKLKGEVPLVMIPLQLTNQLLANEKIYKFLQGYKEKDVFLAQSIHDILVVIRQASIKYDDMPEPAMHDPCVIHYLLHPEDFGLQAAKIIVDSCEVSYGRTNCYFIDHPNQLEAKTQIALKIQKRSKFWQNLEHIFKEIFSENQKRYMKLLALLFWDIMLTMNIKNQLKHQMQAFVFGLRIRLIPEIPFFLHFMFFSHSLMQVRFVQRVDANCECLSEGKVAVHHKIHKGELMSSFWRRLGGT